MNFGDFGSDNEAQPEAPYFLIHTIDKRVHKVLLDDPEPQEMFEVPSLCCSIQATFISGKECVIGINSQMRLYINSKLFSN